MTYLDKDYPARTFRHSVWIVYLTTAIVVVILQQFLTLAIVRIGDFGGGIAEGFRAAIPLIVLAILVFLAFRIVPRIRFDWPVLTISGEGLSIPGAGSRIIPWTAISKVNMERAGEYRLSRWIVLTPRDDLDPETRALFSTPGRVQRDNYGLYIAVGFIEGITSAELLDVIKQYHEAFRGSRDKDAPAESLSIDSTRWTGTED